MAVEAPRKLKRNSKKHFIDFFISITATNNFFPLLNWLNLLYCVYTKVKQGKIYTIEVRTLIANISSYVWNINFWTSKLYKLSCISYIVLSKESPEHLLKWRFLKDSESLCLRWNSGIFIFDKYPRPHIEEKWYLLCWFSKVYFSPNLIFTSALIIATSLFNWA